MNIKQRGAASTDVAIGISVSIGMIILLLSLTHFLGGLRDSLDIKQQLKSVTDAAVLSYRFDVMKSRCLSQSHAMNVNRLINENRLPKDINQGLWTFNVKFIDLTINRWKRPSQIETRITFKTLAELNANKGYLPASKTDHLSLVFAAPLHIDITDNWANFNKKTGCYE